MRSSSTARARALVPTLIAITCLLPGCRPPRAPSSGPTAGSLSVAWTGTFAGRFSAPAEARWCPGDTLVEISVVRHDTAVGLTIAPGATVRAGAYPVYPASGFVAVRPQAGAALRWLAEVTVLPFEAERGMVTVTEGGTRRISARVDARLKRADAADTVPLTGGFLHLELKPATGPCGRANKPNRVDSAP